MKNYTELASKFSRDMGSLPGQSPFKPEILDQVENEPVNLRKFIFNLDTLFSEEFIEDAQFNIADWFHDQQRKIIGVQFRTWLYGQHLETQTILFPKNWFEHLKERVLPTPIKEYWPVKLRMVKVDIAALYPQLRRKLEHPEEKYVIHGTVNYEGEEGEDGDEEE